MGAGKAMLDSCLLDHRSWLAPSNRCSKHACVLWGTSKLVADAKLCETKAETYQVKKCRGGAALPNIRLQCAASSRLAINASIM